MSKQKIKALLELKAETYPLKSHEHQPKGEQRVKIATIIYIRE